MRQRQKKLKKRRVSVLCAKAWRACVDRNHLQQPQPTLYG